MSAMVSKRKIITYNVFLKSTFICFHSKKKKNILAITYQIIIKNHILFNVKIVYLLFTINFTPPLTIAP